MIAWKVGDSESKKQNSEKWRKNSCVISKWGKLQWSVDLIDHFNFFFSRKKVKEQREKVITELLVTEREYCRDLRLTCEVFKLNDPQYLEMKGVDVATLFGNILEVCF